MPWVITYKKKRRYNKLEQYDVETGISTGTVKDNLPSDSDYIEPEVSELCGVTTSSRIETRETDMSALDFTLIADRTGITPSVTPVCKVDVKLSYFPEAIEQVLYALTSVELDDSADPDIQTLQALGPMPVSASQSNNKFVFYVLNTSPSTGSDGKILKLLLSCIDTTSGIVYWEETVVLYTSLEYPSDNSDALHPTFAQVECSTALIPSSDFEFRVRLREVINP